ncbi:MAG: hypothetical protein LBC92_00070, partial [Rickettsiales bacterium]|nr:hypothetical protein [Rickettsiales bacterium]
MTTDCEIFIERVYPEDGLTNIPFYIIYDDEYILDGGGKNIVVTYYNATDYWDGFYFSPRGAIELSSAPYGDLSIMIIKNITFKDTSVIKEYGDPYGQPSFSTIFTLIPSGPHSTEGEEFRLNFDNVNFLNNNAISPLIFLGKQADRYLNTKSSISFKKTNFIGNKLIDVGADVGVSGSQLSLFYFLGQSRRDNGDDILKSFILEESLIKDNLIDSSETGIRVYQECDVVSLFSFCKVKTIQSSNLPMDMLDGSTFTIKDVKVLNNDFNKILYKSGTNAYGRDGISIGLEIKAYGSFFIKGVKDSKIILENVIIKNNEATGTTPAYMKLHSLILLSVTQNDVNSP